MKMSDIEKKANEMKLNELDDKTYNLRPGDVNYNFELDPNYTEDQKEAYRDFLQGNWVDGGWDAS